MNHSEEHVAALIGDIYDAALDPSRWRPSLIKVAAFVGGMDASIIAKHPTDAGVDVFYSSGAITDEWQHKYATTYYHHDPMTTGQYFAPIGVPVGGDDLTPYDQLFASRMYKEWAIPQGIVDGLWVTLEKTLKTVMLSIVMRGTEHGLVDDEARRRLALIAPHQRRAILISRTLEAKAAEADALMDAYDSLSAAMFLVAADRRVVFANKSATQMLTEASLLRHDAVSRLTPADPDAVLSLDDAILRAAAGDAELGNRGIAITLTARDGVDQVMHVLPLTSGERRRAGARYSAVAAVFVRRAEGLGAAPPEAIAEAYKLTPAELRVFLAITELNGVAETAYALDLSENTVRTHLKRIYAKTGTSRQAQLVKLKLRFER